MPDPSTAGARLDAATAGRDPAHLLRTAAEDGANPKWQSSKDGHSGYCKDLIAAVNQLSLGLRIEIAAQSLPQKRLMQQVRSGELDLLCTLTYTDERARDFLYVKPALYHMPYALIARADDDVNVRSWDDLRALGESGLVLLNHDSSRRPALQAMGGLHLHTHGLSTEANLRMLLAGRGRFFYFPLSNALNAARRMGVQDRIRVLLPPLQTEPYFLLARRDIAPAALSKLKQGLQLLEQHGELSQLSMKWFEVELPQELRQTPK